MALSTFALNSFERQNLHMPFGWNRSNVAPRGANNKRAQIANARVLSDWCLCGNTIEAHSRVTSIVPPLARRLGPKFHPLSARRSCGKGSL